MRKIIIVVAVWFVTLINLSAQDLGVIKSPAALMQGYIIFQEDANIDYWEIQLINRVLNSDSTYSEVINGVYEVIGKNYFRIPCEFSELPNSYVKVSQINNNGTINTELQKVNSIMPQVPGGGAEFLGDFVCNGNTYAWSINQIGIKSNNVVTKSVFSLNYAYASIDQNTGVPTPYYEYFSPSAFDAIRTQLTDMNSPNYHPNINGVWYQQYYWLGNELLTQQYNQAAPYSSPSVIKLLYDPSSLKQDASGSDITGVNYVYGIAKGLGPWGGGIYSTGYYSYSSFQGTKSVQWAIDLINNDSQANPMNNNRPSLSCSSIGGGMANQSPADYPVYELKDLRRKVIDTNIIISNWDLLDAINSLFGDENGNWWEMYYAVSLTKISGNPSEVFSAKIDDFFNESGERINVPLNLSDGLYNILIQFANGSSISVITERNINKTNVSDNLSNYLTESIFPVPIIDDKYSISISALKDLKVKYNLLDFNLNILFQVEIDVKDGESSIINIEPDVFIPTGLLVNQFIFEDGSQTSIITTK